MLNVQELLETESEADAAHHCLIPPRLKARNKRTRYFSTPVPFDRHLCALEQSTLHSNLRDAMLTGAHTPHLKIVQGPPGTGKTRHIAEREVPRFGNARIFACAPTNVGAANLYSKIIEVDSSAALLMPMSRVPNGTPITSQDPNARIVCSTISGRAGPLLDAQRFDVVIVDESAQCMEAWIWCLLRAEVHTLILVGDTQQLPALVSKDGECLGHGRSVMTRLLSLDYPSEVLVTQRRMHPEIVRFPNHEFYGDSLLTKYGAIETECDPYAVVNIDAECTAIGTSYVNRSEAAACVKITRHLETLFDKVVIISPYQAQTRELLAIGALNVHTIDSFQGQEADAIVISVVRNHEIGFWSEGRAP